MRRIRKLASTMWGGMVELARPGESSLAGREIERLGTIALTVVIVATNLIGAGAVLVIALFVVPKPRVPDAGHVELVNTIATFAYVAFAVPVGVVLGSRGLRQLRRWLLEERPPTVAETRIVLHAPARLFALQLSLWFTAALLFGALNLVYSSALALRVLLIVALTGLVTASCAYLLTEMLLRPAAARALTHTMPGRLTVPGVATRAVLAWLVGSGISVLGLVGIGILALAGDRSATPHQLGISLVVLGGTGIAVGLLAVTIAARATADPIDSVRRALGRVQRGELDVRVPVYDGTQVGQLQLGFNQMAEGLAERERIREAFGTYVDPDVARHILDEGTNLAGEQVEVTLMFVDIRNFTGFAERTPAPEVVAAINELFEQIVPIIHAHGGRVDKFVGDGLLAVFGAPRRQPDHADRAFAVALEIARTARSSNGLEIGIGLNSGTVVAGNVGGAGRLEFSVIGDAVNIAARVEAATRSTGDTILLTERTTVLLRAPHPELRERSGVVLRGKSEAVLVYAPILSADSGTG
jgi:adenylate cyclase